MDLHSEILFTQKLHTSAGVSCVAELEGVILRHGQILVAQQNLNSAMCGLQERKRIKLC
jgi:hypothetical protein